MSQLFSSANRNFVRITIFESSSRVMPSKRNHSSVEPSSSKKPAPQKISKKPVERTSRRNETVPLPTPPSDSATISVEKKDELHLIASLQLIDPLLQFLTRATGRTLVPLQSLRAIIPPNKHGILSDFPALHYRGVLHICSDGTSQESGGAHKYEYSSFFGSDNHVDDAQFTVGFPPPNTNQNNLRDVDEKEKSSQKKEPNLHGSTKAAAKKRLATLKKSLKNNKFASYQPVEDKKRKSCEGCTNNESQHIPNTNIKTNDAPTLSRGFCPEILDGMVNNAKYQHLSVKDQYQRTKKISGNIGGDVVEESLSEEALGALGELQHLLSHGLNEKGVAKGVSRANTYNERNEAGCKDFILKKQAAFAGSHRARISRNGYLSTKMRHRIPTELADVMKIRLYNDEKEDCTDNSCHDDYNKSKSGRRLKLYSHQATAIEAVLLGVHTLVCTGTGSGKSLCFLLPILAEVMTSDLKYSDKNVGENDCGNAVEEYGGCTALLMFPTKALAQDQLSKLLIIVKSHPLMEKHIRPGVIDGDTPHPQRSSIAKHCNIILSNPDTLHAAILPQWKGIYKGLLAQMKFVVVDELHVYEGTFGAHVSLVLSRLLRVCCIAKCTSAAPQKLSLPIFIGCSATICHPEEHFRLLCPIASENPIRILTQEEDGSPCSTKHFFVWNPPLIDIIGNSRTIGRPQNSKVRV